MQGVRQQCFVAERLGLSVTVRVRVRASARGWNPFLLFFFLLCECGGHHLLCSPGAWPALSMSHVSMTSSSMKRGIYFMHADVCLLPCSASCNGNNIGRCISAVHIRRRCSAGIRQQCFVAERLGLSVTVRVRVRVRARAREWNPFLLFFFSSL